MTSVDATGRGPRSEPKVGDRVRITLDVTITDERDSKIRGGVCLGELDGICYDITDEDSDHRALVSVEVLAPPEIPWRAGDVVVRDLDDDGRLVNTATYIGNDRWRIVYPWAGTGEMATKRALAAPHTVLVRGGQIVGGASQ